MRYCLMVEGNEDVQWPDWLALADACERHGFDALFRSDHYLSVHAPNSRGAFDAWTTIAGLGARTERIRLGTLVTPATFRHPSVLARAVTTADHISGGRVEIGLGAGWYKREHDAHGIAFPPPAMRFELLAEQLEILSGLFSASPESYSYVGSFFRLDACAFLPKPVQRPHPPIILGGTAGPKMTALVARFADEFNSNQGSPKECAERFARVRAAVEAAGRDPQAITTSVMTGCVIGSTTKEYNARLRRVASWMRTTPRELVEGVAGSWVLGTPSRARERIHEFRDAGVQRIMLQHNDHTDLDTPGLLATEVFNDVAS